MTGYQGSLITPSGTRVGLGERGITTWRLEVSRLNKEAATRISRNDEDDRRISTITPTMDGDRKLVEFTDGSQKFIATQALRAGLELLGADRLSPGFFVRDDMKDAGITPPLPEKIHLPTHDLYNLRGATCQMIRHNRSGNVVIYDNALPATDGSDARGFTVLPVGS